MQSPAIVVNAKELYGLATPSNSTWPVIELHVTNDVKQIMACFGFFLFSILDYNYAVPCIIPCINKQNL